MSVVAAGAAPGSALAAGRRAAARRLRRAAAPLAGSVVGVRTVAPQVVLTFDDGPEPGGTDRVLAALADAGATATFFVLLTRVRRYPSLLDEVVAAGHEVALHGVDHRPLPAVPVEEVARLTRSGRAELEDATGLPVRWHRPPYGRQTLATRRAVARAGLEPVLWGPSTWDWKDVPPADRIARSRLGLRPGAIVLAHDGTAGPDDLADDGPAPVLDRGALVAEVLAGYAERGLAARSLREVAQGGRLVRELRLTR
ncbi:polysaccharide deacetylase [Geodermatophilus tzadiensis]|uniref:Polysaccharide deacetylase n=1 Tax=Geodermatophilus tzadiensis TaxID=1137988 RepID=A0A2T0TUL6_9ACTN|nr:polysaccharide deacetylase family protein [Geodermatophilus tzadiensis]PRY49345.1 polysaccharide deacetylase [Geodermatophilus tzadiensis]